MYTKQSPQLANTLTESEMPEAQVNALLGILGNCALALEHRGPVAVSVDYPEAIPFYITQILPVLQVGFNPPTPITASVQKPEDFPAAVIANNPASEIDPETGLIENGAALMANGVSLLNGDTVIGGDQYVNGDQFFYGDTIFYGEVTFLGTIDFLTFLKSLPGYDVTKVMVLESNLGTIRWVESGAC